MRFPRQEYWSGLPFPPPGDLPNPGIEPMSLMSPALAGEFFTKGNNNEYYSIFAISAKRFYSFFLSLFLCLSEHVSVDEGFAPMFECHPLHLSCPCLSFLVVCLFLLFSLGFPLFTYQHSTSPTSSFFQVALSYTHTHTHAHTQIYIFNLLHQGKIYTYKIHSLFKILFNLTNYSFLAVLGLPCCVWAFSSCDEQELSLVVVCRLVLLQSMASRACRLQ